jgi:hypothetical protein
LYYFGLDGNLMAVDTQTDPAFQAATTHALLTIAHATNTQQRYDMTRDGKKFLMVNALVGEHSSPVTVVGELGDGIEEMSPQHTIAQPHCRQARRRWHGLRLKPAATSSREVLPDAAIVVVKQRSRPLMMFDVTINPEYGRPPFVRNAALMVNTAGCRSSHSSEHRRLPGAIENRLVGPVTREGT